MFPNLEAEQARHRLTNKMTAEKIGLSRTSYESKKKSGKFVVPEIMALCKMFNCGFDYLFKWDEIAV